MDDRIKQPETPGTGASDCGCEGDCCPPKRKSWWPKVIFTVVMLAAAVIIAAKLFFTDPQVPAAPNQVVNDPNAPSWSDSSRSGSCCDTAKSSSCCPK